MSISVNFHGKNLRNTSFFTQSQTFEKAIMSISVNFHGKNLQNTSFFTQSHTLQVCSFVRKLVFFAFSSWKSTALGIIAFPIKQLEVCVCLFWYWLSGYNAVRKLVFLAFSSWKSTALGIIAFSVYHTPNIILNT